MRRICDLLHDCSIASASDTNQDKLPDINADILCLRYAMEAQE